jgi:diguanylate cyclase (GGDEF)-like protein
VRVQLATDRLRQAAVGLTWPTEGALAADLGYAATIGVALTCLPAGRLTLLAGTPFDKRRATEVARRAATTIGAFWRSAATVVALHGEIDELRTLVGTDELTGLANIRALHRHIERASARPGPATRFGIVFIDLNNLKLYNDTYGHRYGDRLLRRAALALRKVATNTDLVARIGGDEFVMLSTIAAGDDIAATELRVRRALAREQVDAAVGAALVGAAGVEAAMAEADRRMYQAKAAPLPHVPGSHVIGRGWPRVTQSIGGKY